MSKANKSKAKKSVFTFYNLTVSVKAESAHEAYKTLSDKMKDVWFWESDTYAENYGEEKTTVEIFTSKN